MNYTRYFIINLVVEGFYSWLHEVKQVIKLSYIIIEEIEDVLNDGNYCYIYTVFCFEGVHIKKSLNAKNVGRLITSINRSHIKIFRCIHKSLTNEEILSMVKDDLLYKLIPVSVKSILYSYNI